MTKKSTQRLKFSAERIRALPCSDGKTQYFYDIDCKGLALSVGKSGQKNFLLYKKVRGKPRRIEPPRVSRRLLHLRMEPR